ncbi:MAG: response regulator transcription factor [Pseudomonadota bacterium]
MTQKAEILICDDEPVLREMVRDYFGGKGFQVSEVENAEGLHQRLADTPPDVIILDINMPGEDGLSALRRLRTVSQVPVIMLTAADEVIDRVVGLEMGADDYLGKPVDLRELEARIKAALRRGPHSSTDAQPADGGAPKELMSFGTCKLDLSGARLIGPDGREVYITAMEFDLLRVFSENKGRVLSRDQLLDQAHDKSWEPFDRSIDLRISRLRRKIEVNPKKPEVIRTVRGLGYVYS